MNKAKLPIIDKDNSISQISDETLTDMIQIISIMTSGSWGYGHTRGKYGVITQGNTSFRIKQTTFERIKKLIQHDK